MNKLFTYLLFTSLSLNVLFGYLSYSFHSDKAVAEQLLTQCKEANQTLVKSAEKQEKVCDVTDTITTELINENIQKETKKQALLDKIDALPLVRPSPVVTKEKQDESYVDLDSKLSPDLVRLLDEAYRDSQGQSTSNAR